MKAVVFTGPSLAPAEVSRLLPSALVLGPVACGDVYLCLRNEPAVIAIIDGYFDQRLSVWHKEILWALIRGVEVWGASSMGALRAAELAPFGMRGVGRIYEWFSNGTLEDDDEVAVTHQPAENGYALSSESMVNVRATLERARQDNVIGERTEALVLSVGKETFYPDRRLELLLALAEQRHGDPVELGALRRWLERGNRVDQKRADALLLIEQLRTPSLRPRQEPQASVFEYTEAWHDLRTRLDGA